VETKYHEDLRVKLQRCKPRYLEVARQSNVFELGRLEELQRVPLQQLWLDHLLAIATAQADGYDSALFVLLAPQINEPCAAAAAAYAELLCPVDEPAFEFMTLERVVAVLEDQTAAAWPREFRGRYLSPTVPIT
jgi:hypothetical protein